MVQPLFAVLVQEVERKGGGGVEISRRLGYDDHNECFCGGRVKCAPSTSHFCVYKLRRVMTAVPTV